MVMVVKGGMKFYRGGAAAARAYVEQDHRRADEYYLAEGSGLAELREIASDGFVVQGGVDMDGDRYEKWVAGIDISNDQPKGRLRQDGNALRFCEVIVNGPKSWSLAAGLDRDVSLALDAAQGHAVDEIGRYLAANVTSRVGPRGAQEQVPVESLEIAVVRHQTSRAGDPHRHIHMQVNARVRAGGRWRGIDSAALLRMQRAINGIGTRAVQNDPEFRAVLASKGYRLDAAGEISALAGAAPAMSKRSAQVAANVDRYEARWREENPGVEPGWSVRRAWDQRAWADGREQKKHTATRGAEVERAWQSELCELGVDVDAITSQPAVELEGARVGQVDRDVVADRAIEVLGSGARGRSAWSVHDVRGVVEEMLAEANVLGDPRALDELAEDVTERAHARSVSIVERAVPAHVRHLTSQAVIDLEIDLQSRFAQRSAVGHVPLSDADVEAATANDVRLSRGQRDAVAAVAGRGRLVVVEGAAGAGKTTVLSTARKALSRQGRQLRVVAPTRKAAQVAAAEVGAPAVTAAQLARAYGYRWDRAGVWRRLQPGEVDEAGAVFVAPDAGALTDRDVIVVDEAGMLDQETARALLTIADETGASVVLIGDRYQLAAVGRGGVLDMAAVWAPAHVELSGIHRFQRIESDEHGRQRRVPDRSYAELSLAMRNGEDPGAVFDALLAAGRVQLHVSEIDALGAVAHDAARAHLDGQSLALSVGTNEQAEAINQAVHQYLVDVGSISGAATVTGADGLPIAAGERVMTRHNDSTLDVANRQTWLVDEIRRDGGLDLVNDSGEQRTVPAGYVREHVHLAYASTTYGAQGVTAQKGALFAGDGLDVAGLYVGMTRGRFDNQVHLVAASESDARDQWTTISARDRADLGLEKARAQALAEASDYRVIDDHERAWASQLEELHPGISDDRDWPKLVETLRVLEKRGVDTRSELPGLVSARPLREENPAGTVLARLRREHGPKAALQSTARGHDAATPAAADRRNDPPAPHRGPTAPRR